MSAEKQLKRLLFFPFPAVSHLVSAVEIAKLLTQRDERLSVTFLIMKFPMDTTINEIIDNSSFDSQIKFLQLPHIESVAYEPIETLVRRFFESHKDNVRVQVAKFVEEPEGIELAGFVIDMFCCPMIDVANEFGLPTYAIFTCGAATLGLMFHLQSLRDDHNQDVMENVDLNSVLFIPTYVRQVPLRVFPRPILDRERDYLDIAKRFRETKGILINTFLELESYAIGALMANEKIPPIYPVGPVLRIQDEENRKDNQTEIIDWLDKQPYLSVVYLCFGTIGYFQEDQVKEIALALEQSGCRFLWSLRKPPAMDNTVYPREYKNFEEVLPKGFLERTEAIGKVIGWAPQMVVLSHPATGGFISHCGWNSVLESVWCGVPMATWPLAAEQQMNAFQLVRELGMAVEIQIEYRKNSNIIVKAEKIEYAIRELMDLENEIRSKTNELKRESRKALVEGGSSHDCLDRFLGDTMKPQPRRF